MTDEHVIGCVKWFNKKSGFGFITVMEGIHTGSDIFVHHNGVSVSKNQYKYLVQGEYVQVAVIAGTGKHEHQSSNVTGIKGGKLMCETRSDIKYPAKSPKDSTAGAVAGSVPADTPAVPSVETKPGEQQFVVKEKKQRVKKDAGAKPKTKK